MSDPTPKEIRQAWQDYKSEWSEIYDEGDEDMRYIAGDPWDPDDRSAREDAGRPCLSCDELNQYLNQYCNNLRQQDLAIEVTPEGDGANDEDAKSRQGLIRGFEYQSNAQGAYICAGESAASRGYGFAMLRTEYKDQTSFDQTIRVERVGNPSSILINPFYKTANACDIEDGFVINRITKSNFTAKYGKTAKITDFTGDMMGEQGVGDWVTDKHVQEAEYWKIQTEYKKLLLVEAEGGAVAMGEDVYNKLPENAITGKKARVIRDRRIEIPRVMQYMTNGLEILDEPVKWNGSRIPIISCFGKEIWMNEGGRAVRKLFSMVRLARDPQMLFAYLSTQECEEAGMVPKVPFVGYKGQFETDKEAWEEINKIPHSFVQVDVVVDSGTNEILPLPTRPTYVPNFQQYEMAKDSARRSIQAAMGISPLPTAAQRNNEKSGAALERIDTQESVGSFHFADNFKKGFLHNMGFQMNELIGPVLDTERTEPIVLPDGKVGTLPIIGKTSHPPDDQGAYDVQGFPQPAQGQPAAYHTGKGKFGVTVSDGPSYASEREQQSDFVDHTIANWQTLGIPPLIANKILAKLIRMKSLGSVGDDIANLLDPPDPSNLPAAAQAIIAQKDAQIQQLSQENQAYIMDHAGRLLEQQTKVKIATDKNQNTLDKTHLDNIAKIIVAMLGKQSRASDQEAQANAERELKALGMADANAHDLAMTVLNHRNALEAASHSAALQPPPVAPGDPNAQPQAGQ